MKQAMLWSEGSELRPIVYRVVRDAVWWSFMPRGDYLPDNYIADTMLDGSKYHWGL